MPSLRVFFLYRLTQVGHDHSYNLALCSSLVRVHCLRVNIERDSTVRVSQELLNGFDILTVSFQQCAEGMPESVPTDFLVNAVCFRNRLNMSLHEVVWPVGLFSPHGFTSEDVIVT